MGGGGGGLDVEYINEKNTTELQRFFHELEKFHYNTVHGAIQAGIWSAKYSSSTSND